MQSRFRKYFMNGEWLKAIELISRGVVNRSFIVLLSAGVLIMLQTSKVLAADAPKLKDDVSATSDDTYEKSVEADDLKSSKKKPIIERVDYTRNDDEEDDDDGADQDEGEDHDEGDENGDKEDKERGESPDFLENLQNFASKLNIANFDGIVEKISKVIQVFKDLVETISNLLPPDFGDFGADKLAATDKLADTPTTHESAKTDAQELGINSEDEDENNVPDSLKVLDDLVDAKKVQEVVEDGVVKQASFPKDAAGLQAIFEYLISKGIDSEHVFKQVADILLDHTGENANTELKNIYNQLLGNLEKLTDQSVIGEYAKLFESILAKLPGNAAARDIFEELKSKLNLQEDDKTKTDTESENNDENASEGEATSSSEASSETTQDGVSSSSEASSGTAQGGTTSSSEATENGEENSRKLRDDRYEIKTDASEQDKIQLDLTNKDDSASQSSTSGTLEYKPNRIFFPMEEEDTKSGGTSEASESLRRTRTDSGSSGTTGDVASRTSDNTARDTSMQPSDSTGSTASKTDTQAPDGKDWSEKRNSTVNFNKDAEGRVNNANFNYDVQVRDERNKNFNFSYQWSAKIHPDLKADWENDKRNFNVDNLSLVSQYEQKILARENKIVNDYINKSIERGTLATWPDDNKKAELFKNDSEIQQIRQEYTQYKNVVELGDKHLDYSRRTRDKYSDDLGWNLKGLQQQALDDFNNNIAGSYRATTN